METTKRKMEESSNEQDHQTKRVRTDNVEVNFSTMTFPQKLWHLVENETYRSIGWHLWGTCVIVDVELFLAEILSRQEDLKIFETSAMKSFLRQLNLYGFKKMRSLDGGRTYLDGVESDSKKKVFYNSYFRKGHPELLIHVKRRLQVKAKRGSDFKPRPTVFTSLSRTPQSSPSEAGTRATEMPLDHDSSQGTLSEAPSQTAEAPSAAESSLDTPLQSLLDEMSNLVQATNPDLHLIAAQLQTTLAAWISLEVPSLPPSALADLSNLVFRVLAQPCPKCGQK